MTNPSFKPTEIYVESHVANFPVTKKVLRYFTGVPTTIIDDHAQIKIPEDHTEAKNKLFLNRLKGELIKTCQGQGAVCCHYHTIDLITNCPLECTYCILQDYLKNNPILTIHTNLDEIFDAIRTKLKAEPKKIFRVGAGELSDSLALDHITSFSKDCVALANEIDNLVFEFKTKTNNIDNLLNLKHRGNVVIAWSLNPQKYIETEELKSASLASRLKSARLCANKGYPIAFHFDPLLCFPDWKEQYSHIIDELANQFTAKEIAWISLGALRFTPGLKKITEDRFPKSRIMSGELFPMPDGKIRYFRPIRQAMFQTLIPEIMRKLGKVPHYLCMETSQIWTDVFGHVPSIQDVESRVAERFLDFATAESKSCAMHKIIQ
ncbi:MAG: hypothetical protein ACD_62C00359G0004 [uncultured bacterium]|nr:MAG: hypothetical protein ACD_62C00359G0004 [uncultured bacterium]